MNISDGEKLILLMLSDLYDRLEIDGEIEPDFIRSAIFHDKIWSIPWKYTGIPFENQETPKIVSEVLDILDMWSFIERSYSELTDDEKNFVIKNAAPFGENPMFPGFDGNGEVDYMGTASFIVNDLDRFEELRGRNFNSHYPSIKSYQRMLSAYKPLLQQLNFKPLSAQNLVDILKEMIDPNGREKPNK